MEWKVHGCMLKKACAIKMEDQVLILKVNFMNFSLKKKFVRDTRLNELIIILAEMTRHN
jgi:hypothetical protein